MSRLLKVFTSPGEYFENEHSKVSLSTLVVIYGVFVVAALVFNVLSILILGGDVMSSVIGHVIRIVLSLSLFFGAFVVSVKVFGSMTNKEASAMDILKVALAGHLIANIIQTLVDGTSVVLSLLSRGFSTAVTSATADTVTTAQLTSLTGQGLVFGGAGLILTCLSLVGIVWSFYAEFVGVKKVFKFDSMYSFLAVLTPYVVALVFGFVLGALGLATRLV